MKIDFKKIIKALVITSPILDLLISLLIYKYSSFSFIGTAIRGVILLCFMIYVLILNKNTNKKIFHYMLIVLCFIFIFMLNRVLIYPNLFKSELIAIIKSMFFPLMLSCMLIVNKNEDDNSILYFTGIIYMILLIIPMFTGTGISSYSNSKAGNLGWFYSPNEISSIVSMLCPFILIKPIKEKNNNTVKLLYSILALVYVVTICNIGTKTPVIAAILTITVMLIISIIKCFKHNSTRKNEIGNIIILIVLILTTLGTGLFSNFLTNLGVQNDFYNDVVKGNDKIKNNTTKNDNSIPSNNGNSTPGNSTSTPNEIVNEPDIIKSDTSIEDNYYSLLKDTFYYNRDYDYKSTPFLNMILSSRDIYLVRKIQNLDNYKLYDYLFGLGKNQRIDNELSDKNIEIDFLDILFNYGIIGFIIYFSLLICVIYFILKYFINKPNKVFSNYNLLELYISIVLMILISCLSGHVLGAPSVALILSIIISKVYNMIYSIPDSNTKNISVKVIITYTLILLLVSAISLINYKIINNNIELNLTFDDDYKVTSDEKIENILVKHEVVNSEFAKDVLNIYSIKLGNKEIFKYLIVERTFENNITYKYFTGKNLTFDKININFAVNKLYENNKNFKEYEITKPYSYTVGQDKLTLPSLYSYDEDDSMLIYKTYVYSILCEEYKDNDYSILKEFSKEVNYDNNKNKNTITLGSNEFFDQLIVVSENNLFDNEQEIEKYSQLINEGETGVWVSYDGRYSKLPYSIEPFTKEGYGRNVGGYSEKKIFTEYENNNNQFFKTIIYNSLHTLDKYMPRYKNGVWLTEYTSTWLKKDYYTYSHYFDTRHNDTLAIYFKLINKNFNSSTLKKWEHVYTNYMVYTYKKYEFNIYDNYGVLALDYYTNHEYDLKTHSSLNHQLAIIDRLFQEYLDKDKEIYKTVAEKYLTTIINIGDNWIKDNNDLWYEIKPDGTMSGEDYRLLTLEDLLVTQSYIKKIYGKKNNTIDKLITSKVKFLQSINYGFTDFLTRELKEGDYIE
ncbi:MAG TPA: hypothetical protein DD613_03955 [Firmicutes bacterium]|nr:hypothetical protein [Bacillota bacterium]